MKPVALNSSSLAQPIPAIVSDCSPSALEWDRFLALLSAYAQSGTGRDWLLALAPSADRAWITRQHALVAEMRLLLNEGVRPSVTSLFDPSDLLAKSRILQRLREVAKGLLVSELSSK